MRHILQNARFNDTVVVFMAGDGVQDRATRSYYFLPHSATFDTLLTDGIRMSDFDELLRSLRRDAGRVVVMLDTCHAGAFRLASDTVIRADDLAGHMSPAAEEPRSWLDLWNRGAARALENEAPRPSVPAAEIETDVLQLLENYRRAHEQKDIALLATVYESFSAEHRAAVRTYLDSVQSLRVELTNVNITPQQSHVVVTFNRRARAIDQKTSEPVDLEVRLTKVVVWKDGAWRIAQIE